MPAVSPPPDMSFCAIGIPVSELGYALPKYRTAGIDAESVRWTATMTTFRAVVGRVLNG